ncbi:MAG: 3'-5' exonuclease [Flavobacteriaceae bacterium TMED81]|nr:MAG: 3'-5' exonuclease [Flavobacteriaceae bacterium TMED81]|tara:strand:+ start:516 stop:1229 length:714 start_codon:yes stop_codon:yes gene_type:complete
MKLDNILFLDIETVPLHPNYDDISEEAQQLFADKTSYQRKEISAADFYERAGIWAEFGKIICLSVGYFTSLHSKLRQFRMTSFYGEEVELLTNFSQLLNTHFSRPYHRLCAHNGKEFDFPYIARRMMVHGLELPQALQIAGKKPWEVPHLDTMELWKFGDYKHYTSLKLLTHTLNIPSPKTDIDGSQVAQVYYQDHNLERIVRYCEQDVLAVAQVILRFARHPLLTDDEIAHVSAKE